MFDFERPANPDPLDLGAIVRQNDQLKQLLAILVARSGGRVTIPPADLNRAASVTCDELPFRGGYRLTATFL